MSGDGRKKFTAEQRGDILGTVFAIAEEMDKIDSFRSILTEDGPMEHPFVEDTVIGIGQILFYYDDDMRKEIIQLVNFHRGTDYDPEPKDQEG